MSVHEYVRREEQAAKETTPADAPALLLEAATMLVDIAIALNTIARVLHAEREQAA